MVCTKQMRKLGLKGFLDKTKVAYYRDLTSSADIIYINTNNLTFHMIDIIEKLCIYGGHTVLGETNGQLCVKMKD